MMGKPDIIIPMHLDISLDYDPAPEEQRELDK
jgi:hypothetical protein